MFFSKSLCAAIIPVFSLLSIATSISTEGILPVDISIKPVSEFKGPGLVRMILVAKKNWNCDSASIELVAKGQMSILGNSSWHFAPVEGDSAVFDFDLQVPDNDTSGFELHCKCGTLPFFASMYFVTTGDTTEMWYGYPVVTVANPTPPQRPGPERKCPSR